MDSGAAVCAQCCVPPAGVLARQDRESDAKGVFHDADGQFYDCVEMVENG